MNKIQILEKLELIMNSFIVSLVASFARLIFYRSGSWIQTVLIFFGGIIFGTLVGYLIDDIEKFKSFNKIVVAASAITAKEIIEFLIKDGVGFLKRIASKKIGDGK